MATYLTVRRVRGPAWDPAVPMRSQALWAEHAAFMNALAAEKLILLGGPVGTGEEVLLVFDSDSEDVVRARLAADPWTTAGLLEIRRVEPWTILLDGRPARGDRAG
jgi:uncharacterized protein YciI